MRPRPQHVLIADDSDDLRALWRAFLVHRGFTVEEARNGLEAVQKARVKKPDLIVMDCWMPVLDGFSATSQLREDPNLADVPVLALSAAGSESAERAAEAGCSGFIDKPLTSEQLMEELRRIFRIQAPAKSD